MSSKEQAKQAKPAKKEKRPKGGNAAFGSVSSQVWAVLAGVVQLVVGVLLLIDATRFTSSIVAAAGVLMVVAGLVQGVRYFRTPVAQAVAGHNLTYALALLILGGFCVLQFKWIAADMPLMSMVFGVVIVCGGILRSQWAVDMLRLRRDYWFVPALGAVAAYVLGAVVLANPFAEARAMWVCIAVTLVVGMAFDVAAGVLAGRARPAKVAQGAMAVGTAAVPAIAAPDATFEAVETTEDAVPANADELAGEEPAVAAEAAPWDEPAVEEPAVTAEPASWEEPAAAATADEEEAQVGAEHAVRLESGLVEALEAVNEVEAEPIAPADPDQAAAGPAKEA